MFPFGRLPSRGSTSSDFPPPASRSEQRITEYVLVITRTVKRTSTVRYRPSSTQARAAVAAGADPPPRWHCRQRRRHHPRSHHRQNLLMPHLRTRTHRHSHIRPQHLLRGVVLPRNASRTEACPQRVPARMQPRHRVDVGSDDKVLSKNAPSSLFEFSSCLSSRACLGKMMHHF